MRPTSVGFVSHAWVGPSLTVLNTSEEELLPYKNFRDRRWRNVFGEKDKLAQANAQNVTVHEHPAAHRNSVDEGTVVTIEVGDLGLPVRPLDHAMPARDGRVGRRDCVGRIASNRDTTAIKVKLFALEFAGNRDNAGVHIGSGY